MVVKHRAKAGDEEIAAAPKGKIATYIADLVREMEDLARREQIEPLDRLLCIAREEAHRFALSSKDEAA